ncbi:MAG: helix-turn-helix domain-containing protein [Candidatus Kapaibacterium sp.]|nr:hypothetical protein [Bacteroidota bacterium]
MKPSKHEHDLVLKAIIEHYTSTQFTAQRLAEIIGITEKRLNDICHTHFGKTPARLIQNYRIQRALEYHAEMGEENFNCILVGFDNHRRYVTALKKYRSTLKQ